MIPDCFRQSDNAFNASSCDYLPPWKFRDIDTGFFCFYYHYSRHYNTMYWILVLLGVFETYSMMFDWHIVLPVWAAFDALTRLMIATFLESTFIFILFGHGQSGLGLFGQWGYNERHNHKIKSPSCILLTWCCSLTIIVRVCSINNYVITCLFQTNPFTNLLESNNTQNEKR